MIFGVGTDIIEVARVEQKLARTERLKDKVYTAVEIGYCDARHRPGLHYAARFAAKEAFLKAMGTGWSGGHKFDEIEIRNDERGKPEVIVHGKVKAFCEEHGIVASSVTLSHVKDFAVAVVVLEKIA